MIAETGGPSTEPGGSIESEWKSQLAAEQLDGACVLKGVDAFKLTSPSDGAMIGRPAQQKDTLFVRGSTIAIA